MPPVVPAEYTVYRTRVSTIMNGLGATASASDKAYAAAHVIVNVELDHGSRFLIVDGVPHLFSAFGRRLLPIDLNNGRWAAHLLMVYGIIAKDREIAPRVTSVISSYALCNGTKMTPRRWSAYLPGDALYLSQYDGTVRRITGAGVEEGPNCFLVDDASPIYRGENPPPLGAPVSFEIEDNGTHVLFADDDAGSVPVDPPIGRTGELFKLLRGISWATNTLSGMRPKHQVQAMMIWMLALAFPDAFPTKPVLMVEGPPGSGKSTVLQLIQQALFGEVQPFTVSEDGLRDFWVAMVQSPIMVLDNTDDVIKWLPDQINAYVTRGYRKERRLHTNTGTVEIRPHSFIAVASQDPRSFRRGDTADRMIVLRMAERFGPGRRGGDSIAYLTARIAQQRARIYGEWVYYLNRVVAALKREPVRHTTARLGDFEVFAYAACRALGWQSTLVVPMLMSALGRERATFAAETDIVLDVVTDWLAFPGTAGRPVSIRQLFTELSGVAATNNKPFVKTPQALAQRLQAPHVKLGCHVHSFIQGDHRMYQLYQPLGDGN